MLSKHTCKGHQAHQDGDEVFAESGHIAKLCARVFSASTKRISAKKAMNLHKERAMESMFKELQTLNDKGTFTPVDPNALTRRD
jgi:hypothetical protein